jgi:hypothetical protein
VKRLRFALAVLGRIVVVAVIATFVAVVGVQYARVIGKNAGMARELAATNDEVRALDAKRLAQDQEIRRLSDPLGVIPEIHDKLHLVRNHELMIYLQHADRH